MSRNVYLYCLVLAISIMEVFSFGCGGSSELMESVDYDYDTSDGSGDTGEPTDIPPPEEPEEETFLRIAPTVVENFVFVINPDLNSVSKIDYSGLKTGDVAIDTIPVGKDPSMIEVCRPTAEIDCVNKNPLTLNLGDNTVSVIDYVANTSVAVDIRRGLNHMIVAPDGRFAIAYFSEAKAAELGADSDISGSGSHNDLTLIDIGRAESVSWAIGLNPSEVAFTADGKMAVIASISRITTLDLTVGLSQIVPHNIVLGDLDATIIEPTDMELSADGSYAYLLAENDRNVYTVDLQAETYSSLPLPAVGGDLDIVPGNDYAVVVSPGAASTIYYVGPGVNGQTIEVPTRVDQIVTTADGRGLLYTNDRDHPLEELVLVDLQARSYDKTITLVKPVRQVFPADDGQNCLIFHSGIDGDSPISSDFYNDHSVVTIMNLAGVFSFNPIALDSSPDSFVYTDDSAFAFALLKQSYRLVAFDMQRQLESTVEFETAPIFLGTLPLTQTAFVSQQHPLGRISFVNPLDALSTFTLTGFALDAATVVSTAARNQWREQ